MRDSDGDTSFLQNCTVESSVLMRCDSPTLSASRLAAPIDPANPLTVSFGFIMDNVTELRCVRKSALC